MSQLPIMFENIVTGQTIKLDRRPAVEAYIKSGDVHKNAHVYDLGWRVDPKVRAEWERRYDDKEFIRNFAKEKKMNPLDITINHIVDAWLDEVFQIDELEMRADRDDKLGAQKEYLQRVAAVGKTSKEPAATKPATKPVQKPAAK